MVPLNTGSQYSTANIIELDPREIRLDGQTQSRLSLNQDVVEEYAILMREGRIFPPVSVWLEGDCYWLADGFHRVAAARRAECKVISAECRPGTLADAQWASFGANADHGLRRTREDLESIIQRAIQHPHSSHLSNIQIAKHVGVAEVTIRRYRKHLSSSHDEDTIRTAVRRGREYPIKVTKIGRTGASGTNKFKARKDLREQICQMRDRATPDVRRLLNIVANWAVGSGDSTQCLLAFEHFVSEIRSSVPSISVRNANANNERGV